MNDCIDFGELVFIHGEKKGRYPFCNSIFVKEEGILIDPSSNRQILSELKHQINSIWLSHWHEDHIMHLDLFEDCPLFVHPEDEPPLNNIDTFIQWYLLEDELNKELSEHWKQILIETFNFKSRKADNYLNDGDVIKLGSLTVHIHHSPGHSPGHLAFYFEEPEILFLGDYDLTRFGPWYGDRYSNIDSIIDSVQKLRKIPAKTLLASHENGIYQDFDDSLWDSYLAVIERREEKLYNLLGQPKTLEEIGKAWIVYGKPIKPIIEFEMIERISMKKHADRLINQKKITLEDGIYSRVN